MDNQNINTQETIIIEDEEGKEITYTVDAIIEMNQKEYVLYSHKDELLISQITKDGDEEFLDDITDEEMQELLNAYEQALLEEDA